jgi:MscS family membrane protein
VNATVENLSLRAMRRQRFFLQVTYDTSREKMEDLISGVRGLIEAHPLTNKTNHQVRFNNFSESSLDILVLFYLETQDYGAELREREVILFQTMNLVDAKGIAFAFPTRTLQIDLTPTDTTAVRAIMAAS